MSLRVIQIYKHLDAVGRWRAERWWHPKVRYSVNPKCPKQNPLSISCPYSHTLQSTIKPIIHHQSTTQSVNLHHHSVQSFTIPDSYHPIRQPHNTPRAKVDEMIWDLVPEFQCKMISQTLKLPSGHRPMISSPVIRRCHSSFGTWNFEIAWLGLYEKTITMRKR